MKSPRLFICIWAFSAHLSTLCNQVWPVNWKNSEKSNVWAVERSPVDLLAWKQILGKFSYFFKIFWIFMQNWTLWASFVQASTYWKAKSSLKWLKINVKSAQFSIKIQCLCRREAPSGFISLKTYFAKVLIFFQKFLNFFCKIGYFESLLCRQVHAERLKVA